MVGPIGVDGPELGQAGIALFLVAEVGLTELKVAGGHGHAQIPDHPGNFLKAQGGKAGDGLYVLGHIDAHFQGFRLFQRGLAAFHRVDDVVLDARNGLAVQIALQHIDRGGLDLGPLALGKQLDTLGCRVGALVILSGQIFHREHLAPDFGQGLEINLIAVGFGEHRGNRPLVFRVAQSAHVVALEHPCARQSLYSQRLVEISAKALGLHVKARALFHKDAAYIFHQHSLPLRGARPHCLFSRDFALGKKSIYIIARTGALSSKELVKSARPGRKRQMHRADGYGQRAFGSIALIF